MRCYQICSPPKDSRVTLLYVVVENLQGMVLSHVFIHSSIKKGHPFGSLAGKSFLRTAIVPFTLKLSVQSIPSKFPSFYVSTDITQMSAERDW